VIQALVASLILHNFARKCVLAGAGVLAKYQTTINNPVFSSCCTISACIASRRRLGAGRVASCSAIPCLNDQAEDYLPHLFGSKGFGVVKGAAALPQVLPRLYAQLTTVSSAQV
jgi:hypothetical protein